MERLSDIGHLLVERRRALGLSQRALGQRVGVLQPQVARWEADEYASAALSRVSSVAHALGVDLAGVSQPLVAAESPAIYAPDAPLDRTLSRAGLSEQVLGAFCRSHQIARLAFFGSVLTERFSSHSDLDVLVDYEPGHTPSLLGLGDHELELSALAHRRVDLHTRASVERNPNPVVREEILRTARVMYGD